MIQIDMDMPKSCAVCRFNSRCANCECAWNYCTAAGFEDDDDTRIGCFNDGTREYDPEIGFTPEDRRQDWCPLKEVKHGEWIKEDEMKNLGGDDRVQTHVYYTVYRCSSCQSIGSTDYKYCPYCGADMREEI